MCAVPIQNDIGVLPWEIQGSEWAEVLCWSYLQVDRRTTATEPHRQLSMVLSSSGIRLYAGTVPDLQALLCQEKFGKLWSKRIQGVRDIPCEARLRY
ncbi:hypothetical protein E2C01_040268 [Portunus trituberculatus]|uniref:Uncharacterized protein n=1 Tax=Portunus trituberculatus TaxID=210409 RepID=A0A5B7FMI9_PORTR|nr:hypothetical protein [Portunus trituberculatus]